MQYDVLFKGRKVSPEETLEILGADKGKAEFCLLPSGALRLRIFRQGRYVFFALEETEFRTVPRSEKTKTADGLLDFVKEVAQGIDY